VYVFYESFSEEEQHQLQMLADEGYDRMMVIQIDIACDQNRSTVRELLQSMQSIDPHEMVTINKRLLLLESDPEFHVTLTVEFESHASKVVNKTKTTLFTDSYSHAKNTNN
jgi:hypothetical protein